MKLNIYYSYARIVTLYRVLFAVPVTVFTIVQ